MGGMRLDFLSKRRNLILGGLLALVALGMFTAGKIDGGPANRSIGVVGGRAQVVVGQAKDLLSSLFSFFTGPSEEELLRGEAENLRREVVRLKEAELENERLRQLLKFKETNPYRLIPARVVGRSGAAWYRNVVINQGLSDGVQNGMAVVTAAGVVGRTYEVSGAAARVMLLTDSSSAVDAIIQRSRAQVIVEGNLSAHPNLLYLAKGVDAEEGDLVVTSGLDGIYPKGLLLGSITGLKNPSGDIFREARLEPGVDFGAIEEVMVIAGSAVGLP